MFQGFRLEEVSTPDDKGSDVLKAVVKSGDLFISETNQEMYKLYFNQALANGRRDNKNQWIWIKVGTLIFIN